MQLSQYRQAIVIAVTTTLVAAAPASAETVLLVTGSYASAADQLGVDFTMPPGQGRFWVETYASAGGIAPNYYAGMPPGVTIGTGGIDSVVRLFNSSNVELGVNDDHDSTLDSFLVAGVIFFAPAGYTQLPALAAGDYRFRQDVFGSNLNNGTFALTATSFNGFDSVGSYTINGVTRTPGVTINSVYFGQKPLTSTVPARLIFDSASDTLSVASSMVLYGNHELTLTAGSITCSDLRDGPVSGVPGTSSLITLNGGTLTTSIEEWGNVNAQRTVINHSAGSNNAINTLFLARISNSDVAYNLSGSGSVAAELMTVGADLSTPLSAAFNQSGGVANFNRVFIAHAAPTGGATRIYRITGGTATINLLGIRSEGLFELAGGTLVLPAPSAVDTSGAGRFDWLSGTVRFPNFTLDGSAGPHFGPTLTLTSGRTLEVLGATTNNSVLTLDGGTLISTTIGGPGAYVLNSGELRITGAGGLTVGNAGPLGKVVAVKPNFLLNVSSGLVVEGAASLNIQDGGRAQAASINNNAGGLIQLTGPTARIEGLGAINNSGVLTGNGVIDHALSNAASGEVSSSVAQTLRFTNPAPHANQGLVRLAGGELLFSGALTNSAAGNIEGRGVLRTGGLTNNGDVALSSGVTDVHGDVVNAPGGRTVVSGNADVTFWDDVQNNGALFKVADGASATFFGSYGGAGIAGGGDVYFEADVTPGASPALAQFDGNVNLGAISRLAIELGGTTIGSQYDSLAVAGDLSLAGALDVSLIDGFTPSAGQSFNILDWGSLAGAFSAINLPSLTGLAWNTSELYTNGVLSVASPFLEADFNENGAVNGADLTNWKSGFGATGSAAHTQGDANGDGDVDGGDFLVWQRQLGSGAPVEGSSATVPEPASSLLILVAIAPLPRRARRQACM